jgi:hypothetical protein
VSFRLLDIGVGLHLVDLVGDPLLGVIHPLADLLAGRVRGVLGVVHESHDYSDLSPLVGSFDGMPTAAERVPFARGCQYAPSPRPGSGVSES